MWSNSPREIRRFIGRALNLTSRRSWSEKEAGGIQAKTCWCDVSRGRGIPTGGAACFVFKGEGRLCHIDKLVQHSVAGLRSWWWEGRHEIGELPLVRSLIV